MKIKSMKKQKGMTFISWVVVLAFIGFQGMVAVKVVPPFFEDRTIGSFWKDLGNDASLVGATPKKIRQVVLKKLKINNIYSITKDDIEIRKSKGNYIVSLDYEPRGTIVGKLEYVISFSHEAEIRSK